MTVPSPEVTCSRLTIGVSFLDGVRKPTYTAVTAAAPGRPRGGGSRGATRAMAHPAKPTAATAQPITLTTQPTFTNEPTSAVSGVRISALTPAGLPYLPGHDELRRPRGAPLAPGCGWLGRC